MLRHLVVVGSLGSVLLLVAACDKGPSLEKLRTDGFGCTKAGGGATMITKPGEHCFVCPDDATMAKCPSNPLTSGCKEDPAGCGGAK